MNRKILLAYQWIIGLADTGTGALLWFAPALALRLMGLHATAEALPWLGYIGAFVLSVGLACLYGAYLLHVRSCPERIETVWLLTAFSRAAVALYLLQGILAGTFERGWSTVVLFDGVCVLVQGFGLARKWLKHAR